ncbi:MAG: YdgA family protein [Pseudomonadales bacterium]|nr:YdgA family protein [Pseudomonadales bacterium]
MQNNKLAIGIGLGVILILAIAAAPKLIGLSLRDNTVDTLFSLIPPETRQQLAITETSFDDGWYSSSAEFQVDFTPFALDETLSGSLAFEFSHGPVILTPKGMEFGLVHSTITPRFASKEITKALTQVPFELPEVTFELFAGFDQSLLLELTIAPVTITEPAASVSFEGLTGTLLANPDMSAEIQMMMGSLRATESESGMGFELASMQLASSSEQINNLFAPSDLLLSIPSISSQSPLQFSVEGVEAQSRVRPGIDAQRQIDVYQRFSIDNISSDIPIRSLSWTTEVNELQTALVSAYYDLIANFQQQMAAGSGAMPSEEDAVELALLLAQNGLVFNNQVAANIYDGDNQADIRIRWLGLPQLQSMEEIEISEVIAALEVEVNVSLDLEAIMRSPAAEMVDPYVQQGYISIDNGRLLLDVSLANSELTINGEVTPLDQFL